MNKTLKRSVPFALPAGTLALALGGCGSMDHRYGDRADRTTTSRSAVTTTTVDRTIVADRSGYVADSTVVTRSTVPSSVPAVVEPFSAHYAPFPASSNESAGVIGHSFYCMQHYNQPGCQTADGYGRRYDDRYDRRSSVDVDRRY